VIDLDLDDITGELSPSVIIVDTSDFNVKTLEIILESFNLVAKVLMNEFEINRFLNQSKGTNLHQYKLAFISLDADEKFDGLDTAIRFKRENYQLEVCGMVNELTNKLEKQIREASIANLIQRPFNLKQVYTQIQTITGQF